MKHLSFGYILKSWTYPFLNVKECVNAEARTSPSPGLGSCESWGCLPPCVSIWILHCPQGGPRRVFSLLSITRHPTPAMSTLPWDWTTSTFTAPGVKCGISGITPYLGSRFPPLHLTLWASYFTFLRLHFHTRRIQIVIMPAFRLMATELLECQMGAILL